MLPRARLYGEDGASTSLRSSLNWTLCPSVVQSTRVKYTCYP